ncbi:hypothetical protein [Microbulbifer rhizosphaerae]|uniref:Uncharacterized protein n=1 Tax=Microbulbifer rhizosphaerae TaxID=1562603 RepID=A0A7W4WDV6_9GAMM|nr:hypothetical protein [Microbulbifer rhizosphaerae]MBB3062433.1 hypothetical protein [Microbulbifer rhizosphaerae]
MKASMFFVLVCLLIRALPAIGFEPAYKSDEVREYLKDKDTVVLAIKVGGTIGVREYKNLFSEFVEDEELLDYWKRINNKSKLDQFLVVKSYKGEAREGEILPVKQFSENYGATYLKEAYLLFLSPNDNPYFKSSVGDSLVYTECDVVPLKKILRNVEKNALDMRIDALIELLIDQKLVGC